MTRASSSASSCTSSPWMGDSMSQTDLMLKDTVLVVDEEDRVVGSASKHDSHVFSKEQPRGILHRAFSVFLFDEMTGDLLLQQRASTKITFPKVWTNTCCSHPLHGMEPSELDENCSIGQVRGVKYAAIRKLNHELGIPHKELDVNHFQFLTRLHYWAADTVTHGPESPWGEHEIDYVLFYTIPNKTALTMTPHPEEVDALLWVSQQQLLTMFQDPNLLFSPWFRIIVQKWFLGPQGWWTNFKECMTTDKYQDYTNIHKFDPPKEHLGGAGRAGLLFSSSNKACSVKKQGAYGKIKTHAEAKWKQLLHLDEVWSAITLLYLQPLRSNLDTDYITKAFPKAELEFCDEILGSVSRSFAAVIRQLPSQLLVDVLIFYLVLRALDTIEDDTTYFTSHAIKVEHLQDFYKNALTDPSWSLDGVGEGEERRLLQQFPQCHAVFRQLRPQSRDIIADITQRMATGMAEFVDKDMGQGTTDVTEYNRYCHFVAGLVGEGLSRLFVAACLEDAFFVTPEGNRLSDHMGLFLQKVNIIRDYLEDYVDGRAWWPQSVWKKYSLSGDLGYFCQQDDPKVRTLSLLCLNELVTDALELAPDCLEYMSKLQCVEVFRFCAIPQVMAIATLDKLYANPQVFTGVVKIRKGLSCQLILQTNNLPELHAIFFKFASRIAEKAKQSSQGSAGGAVADPSLDRTLKACERIMHMTDKTRCIPSPTGRLVIGFIAIWTVFQILQMMFPVAGFKSLQGPADQIFRGLALVLVSMVLMTKGTEHSALGLQTADFILQKKEN